MRLTQAHWQALYTLLGYPPGAYNPLRSVPDQALVINGSVSSSFPIPTGKAETDFTTTALLGPQGQHLPGVCLQDRSGWYFAGLDPRWITAQIQLDRSDPSDKPGVAAGNFPGVVSFSQIAVPAPNGPALTVHQTQTTPNGTRITLEKIRLLRTAAGDLISGPKSPLEHGQTSDQMQMLLIWKAPPVRPDTRLELTLGGQVEEENGDILPNTQGSGSEEDTLDSYQVRKDMKYNGIPFTLTFCLPRPIADGVQRLTVSANYWESAPALRRPAAFTHFTFPLTLAHSKSSAHSVPSVPIAQQRRGNLLAFVASVRPNFSQEEVNLWLNDSLPQNWSRSWWVAQASVRNPQTGQQQSLYLPSEPQTGRAGDPQPDYRLYWKDNGAPLGLTEAGYRLDFSPQQFEPRPSSVVLNLALEMRCRSHYLFDLPDLPVPLSSIALPVSRRIAVAGLGTFETEAIKLFDQDHPLQNPSGRDIAVSKDPDGMALALKFTPEKPGLLPSDAPLLVSEMTTRDASSTDQTRDEPSSPVWADLVSETAADSPESIRVGDPSRFCFVTLPLRRAPAGKNVFTLHLAFDKALVTDRRGVTLTVPVVSLPAHP